MDNIKKIYEKKQTFTGKYGSDVVIALLIIYVFIIGAIYFYIINNIPTIKENWPQNKCNPIYLPFAGLVVDNKDKSNLELVSDNFQACTRNILTSIASEALRPIYYVMGTLTGGFKEMSNATNAIRAFFNKVRVDVADTSKSISGRTLNTTIPFVKQMIYFKSILSKTIGLFTGLIYSVIGSYMTLQALGGSIIDMVETILKEVGKAIGITMAIPFIGPLLAAPLTAFEAAILILFMPVSLSFSQVFRTACFDKYTQISLANNTTKNISDINIDDKLHDGSVVTGIMKMSSYGQSVYNLNGIIVTGLHRIYHNTFGWIKVADHPQALLIEDYRESIVYCINTDTKVIKIGDQTFTDWDDLDDKDLSEINKSKSLTKHITNKDIHPYLDNGFEENTLIELEIGSAVKIKDIEVNDVLRFGERVLGIIKIDAREIVAINEYLINDTPIICCGNIQVYNENLGDLNINSLEGTPVIIKDYLYQLITDKGSFHINGLKVSDYNFGIEKYLDNIYLYPQNLYH